MVRIKKVRKTSVLLDIITSRRAVDTASRQSIVALVIVTYLRLYLESSKVLGDIIVYLYRFGNTHAKPFPDKNSVKDMVNPWLGNEFDQTEIKQVMTTASMCIYHIATMRPDINRQKPCQGGAVIVNTCDLQDHTTTLYLNELIYHRR
ncbi:hypothetical protein IGI04_030006 [Brassica rapa subsp. trilocularis]|uniref:Uncharacterized protein n=1 Tax=Brassica rapa subsp. trilocularis TaxID=1813537 RepID=A0ABQ7LS58_BRACM|nr:hypothetical protein IGI04_030006 [Brassica rapa subsp. trilocularis]